MLGVITEKVFPMFLRSPVGYNTFTVMTNLIVIPVMDLFAGGPRGIRRVFDYCSESIIMRDGRSLKS